MFVDGRMGALEYFYSVDGYVRHDMVKILTDMIRDFKEKNKLDFLVRGSLILKSRKNKEKLKIAAYSGHSSYDRDRNIEFHSDSGPVGKCWNDKNDNEVLI